MAQLIHLNQKLTQSAQTQMLSRENVYTYTLDMLYELHQMSEAAQQENLAVLLKLFYTSVKQFDA